MEETLKAANLDWEPLEDTVSGTDTAIVMPRMKLLYRSDTKEALGVVGKGYSPSQPREFLKEQFEFADFIKGKVTRAGFLEERCRAFAFVKLDVKMDIPCGARKLGDPMAAYIYSTDGWDGATPRRSRLYIERLRCLNGQVSREIKSNMWVSHTSNRAELHSKRWKTFMNDLQQDVDGIKVEFTKLAQARMTADQFEDFLKKLMPSEGTKADNRRTKLVELFNTGEGNEGKTRWDAFNAVTEYATHFRNYRETDVRSVETNRFLGVMERNKLGKQALNLLLN